MHGPCLVPAMKKNVRQNINKVVPNYYLACTFLSNR